MRYRQSRLALSPDASEILRETGLNLLGRRNRVRQAAERLLAGSGAPDEDLAVLLRELEQARPPWTPRRVVAQLLSRLPLDEGQRATVCNALAAVLRPNWLSAAAGKRIHRAAIGAALVGLSVGWVLSYENGSGVYDFIWFAAVLAGISYGLVMPAGCAVDARCAASVREVAIGSLCNLQALLAVPEIAPYAVSRPARTRAAATMSLMELLPQIGVDAYGRIPGLTRNLCQLLPHAQESLALAILGALERAGDGTAVKSVQRLGTRSRSLVVRGACERVMPILEARRRWEESDGALLHASSLQAPEEQLLRAHTGGGEVAALLTRSFEPAAASQAACPIAGDPPMVELSSGD